MNSYHLNNQSSSSSSRIRNRYLSKLGILPEGPKNGPRNSGAFKPLPCLMVMRTPRTDNRRKQTENSIGPNLTSLSDNASSLPAEEIPRETLLSTDNSVGLTRTSIGDTLLPEEEIPELSLKGLAFLNSVESVPLPTDDEQSFANDYDDDYDDEEEEANYENLSYLQYESPSWQQQTTQQPQEEEEEQEIRVHFHSSVTVYEIPSHREYDEISRNSMWNSFRVQEQNARRNILEFSADQSDWRKACEEVDMIPTRRGELIHPATWKLICERMAYLQNNKQLLRFAHQMYAI